MACIGLSATPNPTQPNPKPAVPRRRWRLSQTVYLRAHPRILLALYSPSVEASGTALQVMCKVIGPLTVAHDRVLVSFQRYQGTTVPHRDFWPPDTAPSTYHLP